MSLQYPPVEPPVRRGLGLGVGAALGVLVGLLGPILLALLIWGITSISSSQMASDLSVLVLYAILGIPVLLLIGGCVLMVPDRLRGWGIAALVASGVWILCSAGVCTVVLFGALATYETAGMMLL